MTIQNELLAALCRLPENVAQFAIRSPELVAAKMVLRGNRERECQNLADRAPGLNRIANREEAIRTLHANGASDSQVISLSNWLLGGAQKPDIVPVAMMTAKETATVDRAIAYLKGLQ